LVVQSDILKRTQQVSLEGVPGAVPTEMVIEIGKHAVAVGSLVSPSIRWVLGLNVVQQTGIGAGSSVVKLIDNDDVKNVG
jgi:hypothetical protein